GKEKVILFNYSGHGLLDLGGYDKYLSGKIEDVALSDEDLSESLKAISKLPKAKISKTGRWVEKSQDKVRSHR
ncbi:MAG: hypothetical protein KBB52_06560, partial [Candidatus Omnitrophica bacterium]|nr:hypothetical protein [Candidatus Omnitrophota bacterium]